MIYSSAVRPALHTDSLDRPAHADGRSGLRRTIRLLLLVLTLPCAIVGNVVAAADEKYPDRPIHLIDPYGAGGR